MCWPVTTGEDQNGYNAAVLDLVFGLSVEWLTLLGSVRNVMVHFGTAGWLL
jgi:hypothetical protein